MWSNTNEVGEDKDLLNSLLIDTLHETGVLREKELSTTNCLRLIYNPLLLNLFWKYYIVRYIF